MAAPLSRYDFVHQPDGAWTWHRTDSGKSTTALSARRQTIGAVMADAIVHGFRPSVDHWIVDTLQTVSYFEPGSPPKTLNKPEIHADTDTAVGTIPVGSS